MNSAVR